jgi:hypothetical protein
VLEIRERPPFNVKTSTAAPWEVVPEIRGRPPFNAKNIDDKPGL